VSSQLQELKEALIICCGEARSASAGKTTACGTPACTHILLLLPAVHTCETTAAETQTAGSAAGMFGMPANMPTINSACSETQAKAACAAQSGVSTAGAAGSNDHLLW
jgi:hypothetical protein